MVVEMRALLATLPLLLVIAIPLIGAHRNGTLQHFRSHATWALRGFAGLAVIAVVEVSVAHNSGAALPALALSLFAGAAAAASLLVARLRTELVPEPMGRDVWWHDVAERRSGVAAGATFGCGLLCVLATISMALSNHFAFSLIAGSSLAAVGGIAVVLVAGLAPLFR